MPMFSSSISRHCPLYSPPLLFTNKWVDLQGFREVFRQFLKVSHEELSPWGKFFFLVKLPLYTLTRKRKDISS